MANEITYQSQIYLRNGQLVDTFASGSLTANQTTAGLMRNVQSIAAGVLGVGAGTALDLGSVVAPGWAVFTNLDATNFVYLGSQVAGVFQPFLKLKPGEAQMVRIGVAAPYAMSDTAAINLFYIIYET